MTRTLVASLCLGLALVSVGCVERRQYRREYSRTAGRDRDDRLDLNRASQRQLERLPGISAADADRIVANRPYQDAEQLVRRGIIGPRKFDAIEDYVYTSAARRGGQWDDDRRYNDDRRHQHWDDDRD
jgi:hypothetical protein